MKFDDINLNDDKAAPKLDLDFGLGDSVTSDKKSGGGFSFGGSGGGWGGGWGLGTGATSWGFGGADEKKEEKVVDDSWNFASTKTKTKDKKKDAGFNFDFGDGLVGDGEDLGLGNKDKAVEDDPW